MFVCIFFVKSCVLCCFASISFLLSMTSTGIQLKRTSNFVCSLTSRAWLVLWKAHVYVTESFLVMLCEYDCFPLLPSHDSTTVVLLLFTSCRGQNRSQNMFWITEQQYAEHCNKVDHSWRQTWLFWLAGKISHQMTTLCSKHTIKHTPSWSRAHSRQSRWSQTQRLSGQTRCRSSLKVRLGPCHKNTPDRFTWCTSNMVPQTHSLWSQTWRDESKCHAETTRSPYTAIMKAHTYLKPGTCRVRMR